MKIFPEGKFDSIRETLRVLVNEVAEQRLYQYSAVEQFRAHVVEAVDLLHPLADWHRIKLIFDTNVMLRWGYRNWIRAQDEDSLWKYPGTELKSCGRPRVIRDWKTRWMQAGGKFHDGER